MTHSLAGGPKGAWYGNERERVHFERHVREHYPAIQRQLAPPSGEGLMYSLTLDVWHYGPQRVRIVFKRSSKLARVFPIGGESSWRHRNGDGSLCLWYPGDPPDRQWSWDGGLAQLIVLAQLHLFREEWFREYGEWLGPEVHGAAA